MMQKPNAPESAQRPSFTEDKNDGAHSTSTKEAFAAAAAHLKEIRTYAAYYVAATVDGFKSSVKSALVYAAAAVLGGIAGAAILTTAAVLLVLGISEGLTLLFGGRVWLADLVTGVVLLGLVLGMTYLLIGKIIGKSRTATRDKYEAMKREQFAKHGHDVHERATAAEQSV
jgi:hypothetical protein